MPSKIKVERLNFKKVFSDPILLKELRKNTIPGFSLMRSSLKEIQKLYENKEMVFGKIYVIKINEVIIGWSLLHKIYNEHVYQIYISFKHRRKGYGTLLTNKAKSDMKKINNIKTIPWNQIGNSFYTKTLGNAHKFIK